MGGQGSGSWYRSDARSTVESCRNLDAGELRRAGVITPGARTLGGWAWKDSRTGERTASLRYVCEASAEGGRLRLIYSSRIGGGAWRELDYAVELVTVPSNLGAGRLWYFRCPASGCGRRVKRLYNGGHVYACRRCYGLVHESTRASRTPAWLVRALAPDLGISPQRAAQVLRELYGGRR